MERSSSKTSKLRSELDALRRLVAPFGEDPAVGYVCGEVSFRSRGGSNQEGVYWRYENAVRLLDMTTHNNL